MFAHRDKSVWRLRHRELWLGERTLVMGVLNVTPDSFSDGGLYRDSDQAVAHALRMLDAGADIIDVGGESTRPGSYDSPTAQEEQSRVLPVVESILAARPSAVLSIDTYRASTARAAIDAGAEIVNDVSGFLWDEEMAPICARLGCGVVLMHTRGKPSEWAAQTELDAHSVFEVVRNGLSARIEVALAAGIDRERILLDPGYGFGKRFGENYLLLAQQERLLELGRPLVAGLSRKSFLIVALGPASGAGGSESGEFDEPPTLEARDKASAFAAAAAILAGASIIRTHEIRLAVEAARIADAILTASSEARS